MTTSSQDSVITPGRRAVIAATFTAEPLREALELLLGELYLAIKVEFAPYNQVFQQLLTPASLLAENRDGLNVVLIRWEDLGDFAARDNHNTAEVAAQIDRNGRDLIAALRQFSSPAPLLVCIAAASPATQGNAAYRAICNDLDTAAQAELSGVSGLQLALSANIEELYPVATFDNPAGQRLAHLPYTPLYYAALGAFVARRIYGMCAAPYKVIVLDCDQTLWRGVCGEDGVSGLSVDAPRRWLQEFAVCQHNAGMLLCLCSKNNEADVWEVFAQRDDMALRREHLVAWRINWEAKSANLKSLADELQLGLDSFILIDDDGAVCAEVRARCPAVLTLQLPADVTQLPQFMRRVWAFDKPPATDEDRQRTASYRNNAERRRVRENASGWDDFIAGLELVCEIGEMRGEHLARVAQLTQRTNQFNTTTQRHSESEIRQLYQSGPARCLVVHLRDRFGDYGLVGAAFCQADGAQLKVPSLMLSCRALGRSVEHQMLAALGHDALAQGLSEVVVDFVPSAKNQPAHAFLEQTGSAYREVSGTQTVYRWPAAVAAQITYRSGTSQDSFPEIQSAPPVRSNVNPVRAETTVTTKALCRIAAEWGTAELILAALAPPEQARSLPTAYVAPRNATETKLAHIWQSVLRIQPIGVQDDYFALGGDSLAAVLLFVEIEAEFGRNLSLATLFGAPTIEALAQLLQAKKRAFSPLVAIQPEGSRPPLYCLHAAGGNVMFYRDLATHLGPQQPVYGLQARGMDKTQTTHDCVEDMAHYYLEEVRRFQPDGPYYLCGSSFGGLAAFAMACQLEAEGQDVGLLALFDTYGPGYPCEIAHNCLMRHIYRLQERWHTLRGQLSLLTLPEKFAFLRGKAGKFRMRVKRQAIWQKNEFALKYNQALGQELPADMQRNHKAIERARQNYVPPVYGGKMTLFRATQQPIGIRPDFLLGWDGLARGGIEVVEIPGTHGAVTIDPYAKFLAGRLKPRLWEAQLCQTSRQTQPRQVKEVSQWAAATGFLSEL